MIFKENENKIKFLTYEKTETYKTRNFKLKCEVLENINELITVFNKTNPNLKLNSSTLANIIFNKFFIELENLTDTEILQDIKQEVLNQLNEY